MSRFLSGTGLLHPALTLCSGMLCARSLLAVPLLERNGAAPPRFIWGGSMVPPAMVLVVFRVVFRGVACVEVFPVLM
jgi:hypothetical protein